MKTKNRVQSLLSVTLIFTMLVGCLVGITIATGAEGGANATAPEIVVKGELSLWDKTSVYEPTNMSADGYILIEDAAQFVWFIKNNQEEDTNNYRLATSIDLGNKGISGGKNFGGILDGDGYTITNYNNSGYRTFLTMSGTIQNLNITNIHVDSSGSKTTSFIGSLTGTVDNCHFQYSTFAVQRGGGVAHGASGDAVISNTIVSCVEGGFMKDTYHMGAFVCDASGNAKFVNCVNYADIISTGADVRGGIVGNISSSAVRVENCVNYGDISTTGSSTSNNFTGGIVGKMSESAQDGAVYRIVNCENYGDVTISGSGYIGGIAGWINGAFNNKYTVYYADINNCVNHGTISAGAADFTGETAAGGLVGKCGRGLLVTDCINYGDVVATSSKGYAGGIVGIRSNQRSGNASLRVVNSAVLGTVTSTKYAGGIAGQHNSDWCSGTSDEKNYYHGVHLTGVLITGAIKGEYVGGIMGQYTDGTYNTNIMLNSTVITSTIEATGATSTAGALCGYSTYNRTDGRFCNALTVADTCYINENNLPLANAATTSGVATAETNANCTPSAYNADGLTDGTYLNVLNTYALANGHKKWMATGAPYYIEYFVYPVDMKGASALNKVYDGEVSEIDYIINSASVAEVVVQWYSVDGETETLLDAAPVGAGSYRVKLVPKTSDGTVILPDELPTADFTISKADVSIGITTPEGITSGENGYTATYNGSAYVFGGDVKFAGASVGTPEVTISGAGTTALEPGTYTITLSYAGAENFNATSATYNLTIGKIQVNYPENIWNIPQNGSMKFTGGTQTVTLKDLDETLFQATYENNDASTITVAGEYVTATATIALVDPAHYEFAGEAVTYALSFCVEKGDIVLKLLDAEGNVVDLSVLYYTGETRTFTVAAFNANGDLLQNITSINVLNAGEYTAECNFSENELYNGADFTQTFVVLPSQITVTHPALDKTYDGNAVVAAPSYELNGKEWTEDIKWYTAEGTLLDAAPANAGSYVLKVVVTSVDGNYGGSVEVSFTIAKATPNFNWVTDGLTLNNGKYEVFYDGTSHSVSVNTNSDGIVEILYGGVSTPVSNAGEYVVSATITGGANYVDVTLDDIIILVNKKVIDLPDNLDDLWDYAGNFVYDGTEHKVELDSAWLNAQNGAVVLVQGLGGYYTNNSSINAAASITASVTIQVADPANVKFEGTDDATITLTLNWSVAKATLNMSSIRFDTSDMIYYTGYAQAPRPLTLPAGVTYTLNYAENEFVDAGTYNLVATISVSSNYVTPTNNKVTGTYTILPADAEIILSGNKNVTYDGSVFAFTYDVIDIMGNAFDSSFVTVGVEKKVDGAWVACSANDVRDAGEYRFTYSVSSDNIIASDVSEILTVGKATYPSGSYTVSGNTTVVYDGEEHTLSLNTRAGLDGIAIQVENITGSFTEPGVHTITFKLTGSNNYEPLADVEVTLTILQSTLDFDTNGDKKQETDVTVEFENGLHTESRLEVKDISEETILDLVTAFGNEKLTVQGLYEFIITNADGEEVEADGKTTVTIVVPKKYRDSETLTFIQVTTDKKGKTVIKEFGKVSGLKNNYEYDPETGILTFTVSNLTEAKFGFIAEKAFPVVLVAIIAAVVVVAGAGVAVILVLSKKKGPKPPKAPKAEGTEEELPVVEEEAAPIDGYDVTAGEQIPWWETPVEAAPEAEVAPATEAIPETEALPEEEPSSEDAPEA